MMKVNLNVCDLISGLNKNATHFVWYYEKEQSYDIETLSIDRCQNHAENVHQKLVPIFFLNFGK